MATQNGDLTMYPNPNRGDQLYINLSAVDADVNTVSVDIYDLTGKRISARTIAVQDGFLNTVLDLNGEIAVVYTWSTSPLVTRPTPSVW
jgi:hypothetical protein